MKAAWSVLVVVAWSCSDPKPYVSRDVLGTPDEWRTKVAALGCELGPGPALLSEPDSFACRERLGPDGCRITIAGDVATADDKSRQVFNLVVEIADCEPGVGTDKVFRLFDPTVSWLHREELHQLMLEPLVERLGEELNEYAAIQGKKLEGRRYFVKFGAGEHRPTRCYVVGNGYAKWLCHALERDDPYMSARPFSTSTTRSPGRNGE